MGDAVSMGFVEGVSDLSRDLEHFTDIRKPQSEFHALDFTYYVGRRCRTVQDVAKELHLDWDSVKALDKQYMHARLARAGTPTPAGRVDAPPPVPVAIDDADWPGGGAVKARSSLRLRADNVDETEHPVVQGVCTGPADNQIPTSLFEPILYPVCRR
jgi:hypothetical protein